MPKRPRMSDASKLKQGRGLGKGEDYKPFLTVRDVPSKGLRSREKGLKTQRVHHLLANTEDKCFFVFDWSEGVVDIREQFPLPLSETIEIAKRLGIIHPVVPFTTDLAVMTTDFVLDVIVDGKTVTVARSVKLEKELNDLRVIEKQEIERTYWREQGVDFALIITDRDFPENLYKNVIWIHKALDPEEIPGSLTDELIDQAEKFLFEKISSNTNKPLSHIALAADKQLGFQLSTCLWIVKHLIATRRWNVDMYKEIEPTMPLAILQVTSAQMEVKNV